MTRDELASLAKRNDCPAPTRRIVKLEWSHDGTRQSCEVGGPVPARLSDAPLTVHAILDCGANDLFKIFYGEGASLRIALAGADGHKKPKPSYELF